MVTDARLPVLWLCGAPATGKSTVAWQVFSDLADQGLRVGYLDIDQIGMLQPPPDADPRGHRFKVDNLAGMVRNYRTAGAQVLVISSVIDPEYGHDFVEAPATRRSPEVPHLAELVGTNDPGVITRNRGPAWRGPHPVSGHSPQPECP